MNSRHLLAALSGFALSAIGSAASAQTSVTLSGQLGAGVTTVNHQGAGNGRLSSLTDNVMSASLVRFGGVEDLGDGWKALFRLETGVNIDSGTQAVPGKFWNRQSWVALQMGQAGVVSLGRQFSASTDRAIRTFDVNNIAGSGLAATPLAIIGVNRFATAAVNGAGLDTRNDNSVKYRLSVPNVIEAGVSVGAGEGATTTGRNYSFDLAHTTAEYDVGVMYVHYDAGTKLSNGALPQYTTWAIGGNVKLGSFKPYLAYYDSKLDTQVVARPMAQTEKILSLGLAWDASLQTRFTAAYYHDKGGNLNNVTGRNGNKDTFVLAGYYSFSKRTELYGPLFSNRFTDGYLLEATNLALLNRTPGQSSVTGLSAGIRHIF